MREAKWVCVLLLALVLVGTTAILRAQVNTADLSGQVLDPQGLAVAGAKITVTSLATGAVRTAASDGSGHYSILGLPPGRYQLTVEAKGFARLVNSEIVLTIGQSAGFDAHLKLQTGEQSITVTEAPEAIETSRTAVSETVNQVAINNLPINGRNYINFTLIDSQARRDSAPSIGAAPTSGLNFGGQRARSNEVSVDGADAVDNSVNGIRATVSQEAVQEFQLIVSNYMPEFGRATGGVINIVTKSGSNETHGNVFGYLRHKSFQARNAFSFSVNPTTGALDPVKQAFTRVQAGATLGGPLKKDKTFYFFSYETTRRQETGFTNIGVGNFGLVPATTAGVPGVTLLLTPQQAAFVNNPQVLGAPGGAQLAAQVFLLGGSSSSVALNGIDPGALATAEGVPSLPGPRFPLPIDCSPSQGAPCSSANLVPLPASYAPLNGLRGNYPVSEGTSLWSMRLDQIWNSANRSFVRASVSPSLVTGIQVNAQNQNFGQNAGSRTSLQQSRDLSIVGQHDTVISNTLVNTLRFQFARRGLHYGYSQLPGGSDVAVNITGFAFFGREPFSTVDRIERRWQWTDQLSWVKGHHTFKTGVDVNLIQLRSKKTQIFELNFGGLYNFGVLTASDLGLPSSFNGVAVPGVNAVQSYGLGLPSTFIQGIGNSNRPFDNKVFAGFFQDSWKATSRLTLNYGVRYDVELTPLFPAATPINAGAEKAFDLVEGIPRDLDNFSPRFALAWDPWGDGKTVVRAGYGVFFDHPLLGVAFDSFTAEGAMSTHLISAGGTPTRQSVVTDPVAMNGASIFQGVLNATPSMGYLPSQQRFDPKFPNSLFTNQNFLAAGFPIPILPFVLPVSGNFEYGYAQEASLGIERQIGQNSTFSVSYTYTHGSRLNRPRDINSTNPLLLTNNFRNALAAGLSASNPATVVAPAASIAASGGLCGVNVIAPEALGMLAGCAGPLAPLNGQFLSTAAFFNFFRPSGPNPSFAGLAGGYNNQVTLAKSAGYPTGFGVPVAWGGVDNQESTGSSVYHGVTVSWQKRFANHFQFLTNYTFSHAIDDSTDLQTLLEPQDSRFPSRERGNSTFDQRHRWVTSAVFESPYQTSDTAWWQKFLANFVISPIVEVSSGRPYTVLTGTDFRLDLGANTGRPSVVTSGGVSSASITGVQFTLPTICDAAVTLPPSVPPGTPGAATISPPLGCDGNLGRNTYVGPDYFDWDLRLARKFYFTEKANLEVIADAFNLFNRFNGSGVNPLCDLSSSTGTCTAGQPTAALDPRQFQFALKINF